MALAKQARINRRFDLLEIISNLICTLLPDTSFAKTALYYAALCSHQNGYTAEARKEIGAAIELAEPSRKPGALLALAHTYLDTGEIIEFASVSSEVIRAARGTDTLSEMQAIRNLAISRALLGDHKAALSTLQSQLPVMREIGYWYPVDLLSHLNSIAIELGEVGRTEEANALINFVLRSSFAEHQPEWHDTKAELRTKRRLVFPPFTLALGYPTEALASPDEKARPTVAPVVAASSVDGGVAADDYSTGHGKAEPYRTADSEAERLNSSPSFLRECAGSVAEENYLTATGKAERQAEPTHRARGRASEQEHAGRVRSQDQDLFTHSEPDRTADGEADSLNSGVDLVGLSLSD